LKYCKLIKNELVQQLHLVVWLTYVAIKKPEFMLSTSKILDSCASFPLKFIATPCAKPQKYKALNMTNTKNCLIRFILNIISFFYNYYKYRWQKYNKFLKTQILYHFNLIH